MLEEFEKNNTTPVAIVASVAHHSIAEELELAPGDLLLAVNGVPVSDYIGYRFATADEDVTLTIMRGEERWEIEIEKEADEDIGLSFTCDVFDGITPCRNKCVFCFEDQLPTAARPSLRIRDDDFRLSFLHGNFLSLTNLAEADWERIGNEHLSPLFVSIHATDPTVRRQMLQNKSAPDIREQLRRLGELGIEVHGQIVLCPGWNDGDILAQTLTELAELQPPLLTVGIVPVGLTDYRPGGPAVRQVTAVDAAAVLELVTQQQQQNLARLGTRQVFAADEFYLLAGTPLPTAVEYEEFPQLENGIGLARQFLDDIPAALKLLQKKKTKAVTLVTGTLATSIVAQLTDKLQARGVEITLVTAQNIFFGTGVSVAGLLTAGDVRAALTGVATHAALLLPSAMLNDDGITLDDITVAEITSEFGVPVYFCNSPEAIVRALLA